MSVNEIKINLDELESTAVLERRSLIFQKQYDLLVDKICSKAFENLQQIHNRSLHRVADDESCSQVGCFFIDGARGSGKSTLLRAVRAAVLNGESEASPAKFVPLYPLADIDPTELGKGENFFLYLMGRIYNILEKHFKHENNDGAQVRLHAAVEALRKMSCGMQKLMDANESFKKSGNPEFFLEECIEQCADSLLLRKKLNDLLDKLAGIVHQEVFLVTIDDADLNFGKCEDILEYVRKYMQTPRLIFLFAGDMQLYTHIVRGMYVENFSAKYLNYDATHETNRQQLINQLSDQYLLKLFPVDYRVQTDSLKEILEGKRRILLKRNGENGEGRPFKQFLCSYLPGSMKMEEMAVIYDTLLQMPMRSAFFFLRYLSNNGESADASVFLKAYREGLQEVVLPSLMKFNVDYALLGSENVELLQKTVLRFFSGAQQWGADLSMLSTEGDSAAKYVALYLRGVVGQNTQTISAKLSYWCACFPAWHAVRELYQQTYDSNKAHDFVENCLKLGNSKWGNTWPNLACAAVAPKAGDSYLYGRGAICILDEDRPQDKERGQNARRGIRSLIRQLSELQNRSEAEVKMFVYGVNSCLCRLDDESGSYYYLSVYHLLMQMVEWLNFAAQMNEPGEEGSRTKDIKLKRSALKRTLTSIRVVPNIRRLQKEKAGEKSSELLFHTYQGVDDEEFLNNMLAWIVRYQDVSFVSSASDFSQSWESFMAKCAEATSSYLSDYEDEKQCPKAGEIFQKFMSSVESAFSCFKENGESILLQCISTFPLWQILKNPPKDCMNILNSANIGDFVDIKMKASIMRYRNEKNNILDRVQALKDKEKAVIDNQVRLQGVLQDVLREKEEREVEMKLRNQKVKSDRDEFGQQQSLVDFMLHQEADLEKRMELLDKRERRAESVQVEAELKSQLLERIMKDCSSVAAIEGSLLYELDREQRFLSNARSQPMRRRHEKNLELIQDMIGQLQNAKNITVAETLHKNAQKALKRAETNYAKISAEFDGLKNDCRLARQRRNVEQNNLDDMRNRHEAFRKQAFEAKVAYEIAVLKYERVMRECDEMAQHLSTLQGSISQEMILFNAAEKAYDDAKKPDTGE